MRYRMAAGLSLEKFAEAVGVSTTTAYRWETSNAIPAASRYPKIAKVLGVTPLEVTEMISPSVAAVPA